MADKTLPFIPKGGSGPVGPLGQPPPEPTTQDEFDDMVRAWRGAADRMFAVARATCPAFGISLLADLINRTSWEQAAIAAEMHVEMNHPKGGLPGDGPPKAAV